MMEDFFALLSPNSIILFVLIMTRIGGMLLTAPFFSTYPIPPQAKIGLLAMTAFMMYPIVATTSGFEPPTNMLALGVMMAKELFVGVTIGFCANIIFVAIQMAGHLLSIQMGLAISNVLDPITKQQVPVVGQMYLFLASMIFICINGHQWLFMSIFDSYSTIPPGLELAISGAMVERIIFYTSQIFNIAFSVIVPIYGVLFVADISMGFFVQGYASDEYIYGCITL